MVENKFANTIALLFFVHAFLKHNTDMYLMLSMVSNSLPGTYTCVASTSQGTDTKSGELTVEGIPPKIIVQPTDRVRFGFGLH